VYAELHTAPQSNFIILIQLFTFIRRRFDRRRLSAAAFDFAVRRMGAVWPGKRVDLGPDRECPRHHSGVTLEQVLDSDGQFADAPSGSVVDRVRYRRGRSRGTVRRCSGVVSR